VTDHPLRFWQEISKNSLDFQTFLRQLAPLDNQGR
jgi:hypothetical protein